MAAWLATAVSGAWADHPASSIEFYEDHFLVYEEIWTDEEAFERVRVWHCEDKEPEEACVILEYAIDCEAVSAWMWDPDANDWIKQEASEFADALDWEVCVPF